MSKMGSAGVRIQLKDSSQYTVIENPNAIAGVVGFAPKGELNKIVTLKNTAAQDTTFGIGFNNPKYNQGMYAARAVLNAGGYVEYIRPYGEEIDKTNPRKRDLKSDAFIVTFDRNAMYMNATDTKVKEKHDGNSITIKHFASTRFKTDGASDYGVTRKINNISETIKEGSNVKFNVDAGDDFSDSPAYKGEGDMVLFALVNADPSAANRAISSYNIAYVNDMSDDDATTFKVTLTTVPQFIEGDVVYGPASDTGTKLVHYLVTNVNEKDVYLQEVDENNNPFADVSKSQSANGYKPSVLIFSDTANAAADGYDYLNVKTAVAGRGAKLFSTLRLDENSVIALGGTDDLAKVAFFNGTRILLRDAYQEEMFIRIANGKYPSASKKLTTDTFDVKFDKGADSFVVGDIVTAEWTIKDPSTGEDVTRSAEYSVGAIDDNYTVTFNFVSSLYDDEIDAMTNAVKVTFRAMQNGWCKDIVYAPVTVGKDSTVETFAADLVTALRTSAIGYKANIVTNDIVSIAKNSGTVEVTNGAAFDYNPGDYVAVVRGSFGEKELDESETETKLVLRNVIAVSQVKSINGFNNTVILNDVISRESTLDETGVEAYQLLNLTATSKSVYAVVNTTTQVKKTAVSGEAKAEGTKSATADKYNATSVSIATAALAEGDSVEVTLGEFTYTSVVSTIASGTAVIKLDTDYVYDTAVPQLTCTVAKLDTVKHSAADIYLVGNYNIKVNAKAQATVMPVEVDNVVVAYAADASTKKAPIVFAKGNVDSGTTVVEQSDKVLMDSEIGASFVQLGLANIKFADVNYDGTAIKVYDLTDTGEEVARLFISCNYMFAGNLYEFEGTVIPYVFNDRQLYVGDAAESELEGSGVKFLLNDSEGLDMFLEDASYDLSETVKGGIPSASITAVSFNPDDPAVIHNAIWTYNPVENRSTATLATAYNLFLDKDSSDVTFIVAAGNGVNSFGTKVETLNTTLMNAVLNVCELRKDCFALFDGVNDAKLESALKKDIEATRFGSTLGRWGTAYDFRPVFYDNIITKTNVELAPSVAIASLITSNRSGGIWWYVPAGKDTGVVPSAWCSRIKNKRAFSYPEDPDSDIAKLSDIHMNPVRSNSDGMFIWGDYTMQMEDSAFNQIHVTMLMAGLHKMFYNYLDGRVFRLNTPVLRAQITSDLQAQLDIIKNSNPSGFYEAVVICNDTNNTPDVVDQNKLYVDLKVKPTKSTRYIYLRSEVLATSSGTTITASLK